MCDACAAYPRGLYSCFAADQAAISSDSLKCGVTVRSFPDTLLELARISRPGIKLGFPSELHVSPWGLNEVPPGLALHFRSNPGGYLVRRLICKEKDYLSWALPHTNSSQFWQRRNPGGIVVRVLGASFRVANA